MSDGTVIDVILTFPVVTERAFPTGLSCWHCDRPIDEAQPFVEHVTTYHSNGSEAGHFSCVYCPCDYTVEVTA